MSSKIRQVRQNKPKKRPIIRHINKEDERHNEKGVKGEKFSRAENYLYASDEESQDSDKHVQKNSQALKLFLTEKVCRAFPELPSVSSGTPQLSHQVPARN